MFLAQLCQDGNTCGALTARGHDRTGFLSFQRDSCCLRLVLAWVSRPITPWNPPYRLAIPIHNQLPSEHLLSSLPKQLANATTYRKCSQKYSHGKDRVKSFPISAKLIRWYVRSVVKVVPGHSSMCWQGWTLLRSASHRVLALLGAPPCWLLCPLTSPNLCRASGGYPIRLRDTFVRGKTQVMVSSCGESWEVPFFCVQPKCL